ncbi:MAG: cytochrome b [Candidatus Competibacteraceae bacterium]|nr:cytochrome b [Candidatus Competibacteraceae bacterium]
MRLNVVTTRYTRTAIGLHWLIAVLIIVAFALGWTMADMENSPRKLRWISWHKWLGITVLGLTAVRLLWRLGHPAPALPASVPLWQQKAAEGVHFLLYGLMFAIPLSGWLFSSARGFSVVYLGILPLPDLIGANEELGDWLHTVHIGLNYTLLAVFGAHVGAALKHHFIERDDVLARMVPWLERKG